MKKQSQRSTNSRSAKKQAGASPTPGERLQKILAAAGLGSRRQCEQLILEGRVTVDGQVVQQLGTRVDLARQKVAVDGEPLKLARKVYYLVNKPRGYLCTTRDPAGRRRVIDLLPSGAQRLFTVGRLDENTEGLMLVTNDGDLAERLAHPRYQVPRVYRALVAGHPTVDALQALRQGLYFAEGKFRVRDARILRRHGQATILQLVLTEGYNREVRRLLARVGHKVMALRRVAFGPLKLGHLAAGAYRKLTSAEVDRLWEYVLQSSKSRFTKTAKPPQRKPPQTGHEFRSQQGQAAEHRSRLRRDSSQSAR
ncbi:MAG: hypothetical protein KatS3mg114_0548 [Planctomycetaceae bacterium]|nr:MAG: hypothetical protein KatS3mg114_0548 [Planctomycetaceae bacterium]